LLYNHAVKQCRDGVEYSSDYTCGKDNTLMIAQYSAGLTSACILGVADQCGLEMPKIWLHALNQFPRSKGKWKNKNKKDSQGN